MDIIPDDIAELAIRGRAVEVLWEHPQQFVFAMSNATPKTLTLALLDAVCEVYGKEKE